MAQFQNIEKAKNTGQVKVEKVATILGTVALLAAIAAAGTVVKKKFFPS